MEQATIELNKDCKFDFMWVMDLCMVLEYFIENTPQYHDYNVCTGKATWLTDIAHIIKSEMNSNSQIQLKEECKANENHIPLLFKEIDDCGAIGAAMLPMSQLD